MAGPAGLVIAIDGVIGSGKSTAARGVAQALSYRHLDTGAMYRAVALKATARDLSPDDHDGLVDLLQGMQIELTPLDAGGRILVNREDVSDAIRLPQITRCVGSYADRPEVRARLIEHQRMMGADGGVVAEGRDMSSVVFPQADLKIRMLADLTERAHRRHLEYTARGIDISLEQVQLDIQTRDQEDEQRDYGADGPPRDIVEVSTDGLDAAAVTARLVELARERGA